MLARICNKPIYQTTLKIVQSLVNFSIILNEKERDKTMLTYHTTRQTHVVTKVIKSDMFEVDPGIPREIVLKTPRQALIAAAKGTSVEASVIPTFTEELDDLNVFHTIRLENIYVPESRISEDEKADEKATDYLKQLIEKKRVIFNFTPLGISDDYVAAYVWRFPDKAFVNAIMVHSGHAEWKSPPVLVNMPPYLPPRVSRI